MLFRSFVEKVIVEVTTVNNEFLRELYKKLMARPAVQPINELEVYEAARKRMLDRLVNLVMEKVQFLQTAKDFGINVQGANIKPGDIYVTNDAYTTGSHLNHVTFTLPIFHKGSLVGFSCCMAHWLDVGGTLGGMTDRKSTRLNSSH